MYENVFSIQQIRKKPRFCVCKQFSQSFIASDILHLNKKMHVQMKHGSAIFFSLNDLKILLGRCIIIAAELMNYEVDSLIKG